MRIRQSRRSFVGVQGGVALLIVALLLAACGGGGDPSGEGDGSDGGKTTQQVIVAATDPSLAPSAIPYTSVPLELGFYEEEGLDVKIQPVDGSTAGLQALSTGQIFAAAVGTVNAYQMMAKDPSLRLVALLPNIYRIVVKPESGIATIPDLKGKVIGVQSLGSGAYMMARAMVEDAGLDPDDDVKWLPVDLGSQAAAAFKSDIDAYVGFDGTIPVIGSLLDTELEVLPSDLNDLPAFLGYAVREESIKEDPELVAGFLRALWKSVVWAGANPEAAVRIHWKRYPEQRPSGPEEKNLAVALEALQGRLAVYNHAPDELFGDADPEDVQESAELLKRIGILEAAPETDKLVDLSLIPESNEFDRDAIEADAKDYEFEE